VRERPESKGSATVRVARVGGAGSHGRDARVSRRSFLVILGIAPIVAGWTATASGPIGTGGSAVPSTPVRAGSPEVPSGRVQAGPSGGGAMQIVAHQDDDLLFQSPDLLHDITAGRSVRTVFVTAGDAARDETYWSGRERGSLAAYAQMAGVADAWSMTDAAVPGTSIRMQTLVGAPQISVVFMRLPDGNRTGAGMIVHHHESLMRLWQGSIASVHAVDGSATYTGASLRTTLTELMAAFGPTTVRTQDWTIEFGTGDNADHTATALFVQQAHRDYESAHTVVAYEGYPAWTRLPDVTGTDLDAKQRAFQAYATDDSLMCLEPWCPGDLVSSLRLARQYVTASESIGNSARGPGVRVTASSQDTWTGQTAANAIDGFVRASGTPAKEWATDGGRAGSWIQLDFPAPTTINGVVLYDRPNLDDQITGGTLLFSDGSAVPTGALANNGSARTIHFPPRITTSLRLLITSVSASTRNIGLTQLETYGNMPPAG
jgi:LmbE family N-acetylglucosaminyl deacetylase